MPDPKKIYKKISSSKHATIYLRNYSYKCSNGHTFSFIKTSCRQTAKPIKSSLVKQIINYLNENRLEE